MMTPQEYQEKSSRTLNKLTVRPTDDEIELLNYMLGLIGEWGEYQEAHQRWVNNAYRLYIPTHSEHHTSTVEKMWEARCDELGDVWWYFAAVCTKLGIECGPEAIVELLPSSFLYDLTVEASLSKAAEQVKKIVFHRSNNRDILLRLIAHIYECLITLPGPLDRILADNVTKLERRFPEGYVVGGGNR